MKIGAAMSNFRMRWNTYGRNEEDVGQVCPTFYE
jgi:hypothetical protein